MIEHEVVQGQCVHSLAVDYGFFWETLWNHPANSELKNLRKDPSVLNPHDLLRIPDKKRKEESGATEMRHRFRRKGQPGLVAIKVLRNDEPRANQPYSLEIDGKVQTGRTDGEGLVKMKIPPNAVRGQLRVGEGSEQEIFDFKLGEVDTVDTERGARERLRCLGYDGDMEDFAELLKSFQRHEEIDETGKLDQATQDKLKQEFGE